MELWKRVLIFGTFILFSAGIALISTALATNHWFYATAVFNSSLVLTPADQLDAAIDGGDESTYSSSSSTVNPTLRLSPVDNDDNIVHSGLFSGVRMLNFGLGVRSAPFAVREEVRSGESFMSLGLWISIILFAVLALLWGIVGGVFALINTVIVPYETITGPLGLYVWSTLAIICTFISILLFVIQYYSTIFYGVLLKEQTANGYTTAGLARFDYSFWLMLGALGSFSANVLLLLLSGLETKTKYASNNSKDAPIDSGVLMY